MADMGEVITQRCVKCGEVKPLTGFTKAESCINGVRTDCRNCRTNYARELYGFNASLGKTYRQTHKEKVEKYQEEYRIKNKGKAVNYRKQIKGYLADFQRERRKVPQFNVSGRMSTRIRYSLRNNKHNLHWEKLVGYTLNDLVDHLKKTIPDQYRWEDYENREIDFEIDHIIPISAFNFSTPDDIDFKRCWSLKNLRLIPAIENRSKNAKIDRPFQPALAFGAPIRIAL